MPTYQRGSFSTTLKFEPLGGELAEADRQLAWKAYLQIANSQAVRVYESPDGADLPGHEKLPRGFEDVRFLSHQLLEFAQQFPMGHPPSPGDDFGTFLAQVLEVVLNPFLYTWGSHYQKEADQSAAAGTDVTGSVKELHADELAADWVSLRKFFRDLMGELVAKYGFVDLESMLPKHVRVTWREEAATIHSSSGQS